jgi:hypothetical protein
MAKYARQPRWFVLVLGIVTFVAVHGAPNAVGHAQVQPSTGALIGGGADEGNAITDATVRLGNGCTGTLVARNVVLTAGHCVGNRQARPSGAATNGDWETAGNWYRLTVPIEILFGNDAAGVNANRDRQGVWETFTLEADGRTGLPIRSQTDGVRFRTSGGFYLVAENGGGAYVGADRRWAAEWETFRLVRDGGGMIKGDDVVSLVAHNGDYVAAEEGGGDVLNADRDRAGPWERFTIVGPTRGREILGGESVALRAHNRDFVAAEHGGGAYALRVEAHEYNLPVAADIILLRLDRDVPPQVAIPATVLTRLPGEATDATAFWRGQSFRLAGWGGTDTNDRLPRYRQTATGRNGRYPCDPWRDGATLNFFCVTNQPRGVSTWPGDSGGPLYWTDRHGSTFVIGALQGPGIPEAGSRYTPTFAVGGQIINGTSTATPNIAVWLERSLDLPGDCVGFDAGRLATIRNRSRFVLRDGHGADLIDFATEAEARQMVAAMQHYRLDRLCFVGRPDPSFWYFLAGNRAPTGGPGNFAETCRTFVPAELRAVNHAPSGGWILTDGGMSLPQRFGRNEIEAKLSLGIIKRYGFRRVCGTGNSLLLKE